VNAIEQVDRPSSGVLQILNVLASDKVMTSLEQDFAKLSYFQVDLNGKSVIAMVDNGATHNFMKEKVLAKFGLMRALA